MDTSRKEFFFGVVAVLFLLVLCFLFLSPPSGFTSAHMFRVGQGGSLRSVSSELKEQGLIRSRTAFEAFVILYGAEKRIQYSDYYFEPGLPVYEIARRIAKGDRHLAPLALTIPEGKTNAEIADLAAAILLNFNKSEFLAKTRILEGYLFPDTYFFLTNDDEDVVIASMSKNFTAKLAPMLPDIEKSGKTQKDIITMASIIEREAKGNADREYISGILWKRLAIGMPLQADAAPETYKARGLPKAPIANPGILAIRAALYPRTSAYLYYLHDKTGAIHYARTFAEHNANIRKYLRN